MNFVSHPSFFTRTFTLEFQWIMLKIKVFCMFYVSFRLLVVLLPLRVRLFAPAFMVLPWPAKS
jgi:hypothetical protein